MERRPRLLAFAAGVAVHLVVPVSAVVDADRFGPIPHLEEQDHRVIGDLLALRRELDREHRPEDVIEDAQVVGAHGAGQ